MNRGSGHIKQEAHRDILAVCVWNGTNNCATNLVERGAGKQNHIQGFGTRPCQDPQGACWVHD